MKLDQTDYDNIFLRVREKLLFQIIAVITILLGAIGVTTWLSAKAKIDEITEITVNHYIASDDFQNNVAVAYQKKLEDLDRQLYKISQEIAKQQLKASELSNFPVSIGQNSLTVSNEHGQNFRVETGTAISGSSIVFTTPYKSTPAVVLTIDTTTLDPISIQRLHKNTAPIFISNTTSHGFVIPEYTSSLTYNWVAIGQ